MYILCLIGLWTRSPKTEVEKLRIERLEMFLNAFAGFVKGIAPWILFDCFEEKFLYPLECREVPSGS